MEIQYIEGEIFRYHVNGYLVDLRANYGVGFCGCQDFEFARQKHLADIREKPADPNLYRCKHLKWSRRELALELLDRILCLEGKLKEL